MARQYTHEIDDFTRFDESVTDTNAYVNIRDVYRARRNNNALLAHVARRCVGTFSIDYNGGSSDGRHCIVEDPLSINSIVPESTAPILRMRAPISQHAQTLEWWVRGKLVSATYAKEVRLHLLVCDPKRMRRMTRTDPVTFTTHGSTVELYGEVDLPNTESSYMGGHRDFDISLYMLPEIDTTNILVGAPVAISASSTTSVTITNAAAANLTVGDIIEPADQPKRVIKSLTVGASTLITIYGKWDAAPSTALTLDYAVHVPTVHLSFLSIFEKAVSSFDDNRSRI